MKKAFCYHCNRKLIVPQEPCEFPLQIFEIQICINCGRRNGIYWTEATDGERLLITSNVPEEQYRAIMGIPEKQLLLFS